MVRVIVVDDHPASLTVVRRALSGVAYIELAREARSAQETLHLLAELPAPADVLVVDGAAELALIRAVAGTPPRRGDEDRRAGRPGVLVVSCAATDAIFGALAGPGRRAT